MKLLNKKNEYVKLYTLKYVIDDAIYCFFQTKEGETPLFIKHELL